MGSDLDQTDAGEDSHQGHLAEEHLALGSDNEERYRLATSAGRVGVWDWDIVANQVTWCPITHELHGVTLGDFDGRLETFSQLIHPDDVERVTKTIQSAVAEGRGFEETFRILRRQDGVQRWLWTRAETFSGPTGVPIRMSGATADVTDRLRTEDALRASELRLRLALETVPLSIYYLAPTLIITEVVNPPKGMRIEDFVGRTDQQIYGAEASRPLVALKRRVLESRIPGREEIWLPINGQKRCFVMSVEPNYSPTGELLGLIDAAYDITELKKAEAEIQRTSTILDTINEITPTLIYMKDLEGRLIFGNPATQALIARIGTEHLAGEPGNAHVPDGFREAIDHNDGHVMQTGETITVEETVPTCQGNVVLISTKSPFRDDKGQIAGLIGVSTDITERKKAENAIKESESRFRNMADAAPVLIWVCDSSTSCTYFNATWLDFTGRSMEEELGSGWLDSVHPDDVERVKATIDEAVRHRRPFTMEYRLRRHDGEYRWLIDRATPRFESDGELAGYIGSCNDITDTKEAIQGMQEADKRKDEFIALLAHELRNPLAPIRSSTDYLKLRGELDPDAMWALDIIGNQVNHLSRLVDDLLDVARITRNLIELRKERISLNDVVNAAVETCRPAIDAARHHLTISLASPSPTIEADFARLNQVLQNLLLNAAKYTPEGGQIELRASAGQEEAMISVTDNGIGLHADDLESIFEIFVQADRGTARSQSGLGIGLTLVQRLVHMHGGSIRASSEGPGLGSTFAITLPICRDASTALDSNPCSNMTNTSAKSILIVDDNRDAADVLGKMAEFLGNDVRVVYGGVQAIEAVKERRPDLILMDLGMPEMDGYQAVRALIDSGDAQGTILVALTGWGQEEDKERTRQAGFHHHVVKPVSLTTLTELLES